MHELVFLQLRNSKRQSFYQVQRSLIWEEQIENKKPKVEVTGKGKAKVEKSFKIKNNKIRFVQKSTTPSLK